MTDTGPPWHEITTDDYLPRALVDEDHSAAWIAGDAMLRDLLDQQLKGTIRLRVVLRETVDLRPLGRSDPLWIGDYRPGAGQRLRCGGSRDRDQGLEAALGDVGSGGGMIGRV